MTDFHTIWAFTKAGQPLVSRTVPQDDVGHMANNLVRLTNAHHYKVFNEAGDLVFSTETPEYRPRVKHAG